MTSTIDFLSDPLQGEKPEDAVRRLRDNISPPPTVEHRVIAFLDKDSEVVDGANEEYQKAFSEGFQPFGLMTDGYIIMIKVISNAIQA